MPITRAFPRRINEAIDRSARTRAQPGGLKFGSTEQRTLVATHVKSSFAALTWKRRCISCPVYRRQWARTYPLAVRCFGASVMHDVIAAHRFTARLNHSSAKYYLREVTAPFETECL